MPSFNVEPVIEEVEKIPKKIVNRLKTAASLKPGVQMMDGCLVVNPMAVAIRNAWRFQISKATRVVVVSREQFAAMIQKAGQ